MANVLPYRKASGDSVAQAGKWIGVPRWAALVLAGLLVFAAAGVIAGNQSGAVFQTWEYGIFTLALLGLALLCGLGLTEWFARRGCFEGSVWPAGLRMVAAMALGLGAIALVVLGLGYCHLLQPAWVPALVPVVGAITGGWAAGDFWRRTDWSVLKRPMRGAEWMVLLAAIPIGAMLTAASFPPGTVWSSEGHGYDVLEYHLEMPREYAAMNSTAPVEHNVYSAMPANVEMLYLLLMQAGRSVMGESGGDGYLWGVYPAQFLHAGMMVLAACALVLAPVRMSTAGRVIAGLLIMSVPWVIVTGSLAYNEGGMLLFGALAVGLALGKKSGTAQGILIGIFLGLAVGCKLTAGVFFAVPVGLILLLRGQWRGAALVTAAAVLVFAPWAIRTAVFSGGNPVFPIATSILPRGNWGAEQTERFDKGHAAPESKRSTSARMEALVDKWFLDGQWSEGLDRLSAGDVWWKRLGVMWLIVPVVVVFGLRTGAGRWLVMVLMLQVLAWMFLTQLEARFLLPTVAPLGLLAGLAVTEQRVVGWSVGFVLAVQAAAAMFLLWPKSEAGLFAGVRKGVDPPPIGELVSNNIAAEADKLGSGGGGGAGGKVLVVGDATPLFFEGDILYSTVFDVNPFAEALGHGEAEGAQWLRTRHVRYVLIFWGEIDRLSRTYGFDASITPQTIAGLQSFGVVPVEGEQLNEMTLLRVEGP